MDLIQPLSQVPNIFLKGKIRWIKYLYNLGLNIPPIFVITQLSHSLLGEKLKKLSIAINNIVKSYNYKYWFIRISSNNLYIRKGAISTTQNIISNIQKVISYNRKLDNNFIIFIQPVIASIITGECIFTKKNFLIEYSYGHFNCRLGNDTTFEVYNKEGGLIKRSIGYSEKILIFKEGQFIWKKGTKGINPPLNLTNSLLNIFQFIKKKLIIEYISTKKEVYFVDAKKIPYFTYNPRNDCIGKGFKRGKPFLFGESDINLLNNKNNNNKKINNYICISDKTSYDLVQYLDKFNGFVFFGGGRLHHIVIYAIRKKKPSLFLTLKKDVINKIRGKNKVIIDYTRGKILW
ncbi:MAG: hypothetical protein ACTSPY_08655 [Candidatus Helarchaeota archaeon]